jgi:hypothetical protein
MKKFKDIIREFRENSEPPKDKGGGGNPEDEVLRFMDTIDFTHTTADEHEFKFNNAKEAGLMASTGLAKQERAYSHAHTKNDEFMKLYFSNSARTHENMLDGLLNHVANHPKLPKHLRPYVPGAIERIQNEGNDVVSRIEQWGSIAAPRGQSSNMGEITYNSHARGIAPSHINSTLHHLRDIEKEIQTDPDIGYVLRKGEL